MRLGNRPLGFVINFLLGVSWAIVFLGALSFFLSLYHDSIVTALFYALIGTVPGLVGVLLLEHIITNKEKLAELEKQTRLLERMAKNK
jgi:chromate transport protein ChrA